MTWHANDVILGGYVDGSLDPARASSLESHLLSCASCRAKLVPVSEQERGERVWAGIQREMDAPQPGPVEALLNRVGVPGHVVRLLATTPSLSFSWLGALALTLTFALVAGHQIPRGTVIFLLLAPLLPVAGVAAAYGPHIDPNYELGLASPMSSFRILLIRATAVLITTFTVIGLFGLGLPGLDWTASAWLLPGIALTLSSLALATWLSPLMAAGLVSALWVSGVVVAERVGSSAQAASHAQVQAAFIVIGGVALLILIIRRGTFDLRSER
jgi:hypothetical protein